MNKRLKIFGILFAFFYFFIIGEYIIEEIPSFVAGFKEGWNEAGQTKENRKINNPETCFLNVVPKMGQYTYPTEFFNLMGENIIKADVSSMVAKAESKILPSWLSITYAFAIFLSLPIFVLLLYIPVQAYKSIRSIVKDDIFNMKTIIRIRRIGYALLIVFGCMIFTEFIQYLVSKRLIDLRDYDIIFSVKSDYIFLLFGLITLLFAEILKISHTMKEEQDLTI